MFNALLRALIQSYLLKSIEMWQSFRLADFSSKQGITAFVFAVILAIVLIGYPIWIKVFLKKREANLYTPEFKAKYDSVY